MIRKLLYTIGIVAGVLLILPLAALAYTQLYITSESGEMLADAQPTVIDLRAVKYSDFERAVKMQRNILPYNASYDFTNTGKIDCFDWAILSKWLKLGEKAPITEDLNDMSKWYILLGDANHNRVLDLTGGDMFGRGSSGDLSDYDWRDRNCDYSLVARDVNRDGFIRQEDRDAVEFYLRNGYNKPGFVVGLKLYGADRKSPINELF